MSAHRDAERVVALVQAVESMASGKPQTLGDLAGRVFGWEPERVFLAIDAAIKKGQIARNAVRANDNGGP